MKKMFFSAIILAIFCLGAGQVYASPLSPIYDRIEEETIKALKPLFIKPLKIKSTGGFILDRVVFSGVTIGPDLAAEKIIVHYNLAKLALAGGDFLKAISRIEISGAKIKVVRGVQNDFNLAHILADQGQQTEQGFNLPLKAVVSISKSSMVFMDAGNKFTAQADNLEGELSLARSPKFVLNLKGVVDSALVQIKGDGDLAKNKFHFQLMAESLSAPKWGNYILPFIPIESGEIKLGMEYIDSQLQINAAGVANEVPLSVKGKLLPAFDLAVDLEKIDYIQAAKTLKALAGIPLSAQGRVQLFIKGPLNKITINTQANLAAYDGKVLAEGEVFPRLLLTANLQKVNLRQAIKDVPGFEGLANGQVKVRGSYSSFSGQAKLAFTGSYLLGQPLSTGELSLSYDKGNIYCKNLRLSYKGSVFEAEGTISRDWKCDFSAQASGLHLSGSGFAGKMEAQVDHFKGGLSFNLDQAFVKAPLRNLTASGDLEISAAMVGEQKIDSASGSVEITQDRVILKHLELNSGDSHIFAVGQVGVGIETALKLQGINLRLEDLKIVNQVLPLAGRDPTGQVDLDLNISGNLPPEAPLSSLDSLRSLNASGEVKITQAKLGGTHINLAVVDLVWMNQELSLQKIELQTPNTHFQGEGKPVFSGSGYFDLSEFQAFLMPYGKFEGAGVINLKMSGSVAAPQLDLALQATKLKYNQIKIDGLKAVIKVLPNRQISLVKPLEIQNEKDVYQISGGLALYDRLEDSPVALRLSIEKGTLQSASRLIWEISDELTQQSALAQESCIITASELKQAPDPLLSFFSQTPVLLYGQEGQMGLLSVWNKIAQEAKVEKECLVPAWLNEVSGELAGEADLEGPLSNPRGKISLSINQGRYRNYTFDSLRAQGNADGQTLKIDQAEIKKQKGALAVQGSLHWTGSNDLIITARKFPLDILLLLWDKKYEGDFDLSARLRGTWKDPILSLALKTDKIALAQVAFDRLAANLHYSNSRLYFDQFNLWNDRALTSVQGWLAPDLSQLDLSVSLEGQSLGLANLFTDQISWQEGQVAGRITAKKSARHAPEIEGFITVDQGKAYVKAIDSQVEQINLRLSAEGPYLKMEQLSALWYKTHAKGNANVFSLAGYYHIPGSTLDLRLRDTDLTMDLPLYSGDITLRNFSLEGKLPDLKLKGDVGLLEGGLRLPSNGPVGSGGIPLALDLKINAGKNLFFEGGNIGVPGLAEIKYNLEIKGGLDLTGRANAPHLYGTLQLGRGHINILNRELSLLSKEDQKKYFKFEGQEDNYAQFFGAGIYPRINLAAMAKVDATADLIKINIPQVYVISKIKGVPFSTAQADAMSLAFAAFYDDPQTRQVEKAPVSEDEIKMLLLPDFVKSLAGLEKKNVQANTVVADYINSQFQAVVFRGLERQMAKALGLESFTFEYNLGDSLNQALGGSGADSRTASGNRMSVGFVRGFFDKLYIDVRYSEGFVQAAGQAQSSVSNFNYQISYKLNPVWSMAYYQEPTTVLETSAGVYKVTLQAGLSY